MIFLFAFPAFAAETDDIGKAIFDTVPEDLSDIVSEENKDRLFDIRYVIGELADAVLNKLFSSFTAFGTLVSVVVLSAVFRILSDSVAQSMSSALSLLFRVIVCVLLFSSFESLIGEFSSCISKLCSYMTVLSPTVTAVFVLGGNITTAGVMSGGLMLAISIIANLLGSFGTACLRLCFAFSLVSAVSEKQISPVLGYTKKTLSFGIGLILGIFSLIMGLQTSISAAADSASMRTVRFAVGRLVPIVGGAVSDAVSTVTGGLSLIKNTCGTVAIVVILLTFLPSLVSFVSARIVISAVSFLATLFGISEEKSILDEFGSVVSHMIALLSMTAVMFVYILTLFVGISFSIGGG